MSVRLEITTDGHFKFWSISLKGSETSVTYGKIGIKGRTTSKDHGSKENAQKFYDKMIASKKKQGYADAEHPEGDHPSDCSSDESHEPPLKKPKTSSVFKGKGVTIIGDEFEQGLTVALAKAAVKAGAGEWLPPSEYEMAEVVVALDDAEDEEVQICHATDEIKLMTEKEFMDLVGLEATPAVKKPKKDEPLGKAKGGKWDGTLKKGIKVCWIGGFNWDLSNKYFNVNNCASSVYGKINSKLKVKMSEVESNWSHPEKVPKKKELKDMQKADIVVKGSWFTKPSDDAKVKTMAAHSLEVAEKMGCALVDEEAFYDDDDDDDF
eukprot:1970698-Karenia_brevis.AAC.1